MHIQMLTGTQLLRQLLRLKYQALGLESSESRFQILSFLLDDRTYRTEAVATAKENDEMGCQCRYNSEDTKKWLLFSKHQWNSDTLPRDAVSLLWCMEADKTNVGLAFRISKKMATRCRKQKAGLTALERVASTILAYC